MNGLKIITPSKIIPFIINYRENRIGDKKCFHKWIKDIQYFQFFSKTINCWVLIYLNSFGNSKYGICRKHIPNLYPNKGKRSATLHPSWEYYSVKMKKFITSSNVELFDFFEAIDIIDPDWDKEITETIL